MKTGYLKQSSRLRRQRGVSIVEALVALVVISVGMLGIAGLYLSSLQASRTAKLRSYAVELAGSIADRIRANRDAGASYSTDAYSGEPNDQNCDETVCTPAQLAQDDLARWLEDVRNQLPGAARTLGTVEVIDRDRPLSDNYLITITWREADSDIDYTYTLAMNMANRL